jgi:hypothetical protein
LDGLAKQAQWVRGTAREGFSAKERKKEKKD